MVTSYPILLTLVCIEMIIPLASWNGAADEQELRSFAQQCSEIEQGRQFFESDVPLEKTVLTWNHSSNCNRDNCSCRGGVLSFRQFGAFDKALQSGGSEEIQSKLRIEITDTNTMTGIKNFSGLFGMTKNTDVLKGVFSNSANGNLLFGGRGIITRTWQSLCSVLNSSADLIRRLFFALRLSYEHNRALNETIRNMQAHHEAYVRRTETEKEIAERVINYC